MCDLKCYYVLTPGRLQLVKSNRTIEGSPASPHPPEKKKNINFYFAKILLSREHNHAYS